MGDAHSHRMNNRIVEKKELSNAKLLYTLMAILIIADWVMPQYFGIHIGFDFTSTRIMNLIIIFYFIMNPKVGNHFLKSILEVQMTPFLALYMFVMIYTTVLRVNINTFFLNFLDILTFYMVYYGIRYVIGISRVLKWTTYIAWFLGIYGVVEYGLGESLMRKFLLTLPAVATGSARSGQFRIAGPCVHPIGYGLLLIILLALICIDCEHDRIDLLNNPILYLLLVLNVFLTGSRGSLGIVAVETVTIFLFVEKKRKRETFFLVCVFFAFFVVFELAFINTSIGRYIMLQITSVIDELFDTSFSLKYGAELELLSMSADYRDYLPRVFTVEWLNPLLGKGANASVGFDFDGFYVVSIDNYYVATYIRYAYPGLVTFGLFQVMTVFYSFYTYVKNKSGLALCVAIGFTFYSIALYWVDYLQTTKYMYIAVAIYSAYYSEFVGHGQKA